MKSLFVFLLLASASPVFLHPSRGTPDMNVLDIYLIAGQSNASGTSIDIEDPEVFSNFYYAGETQCHYDTKTSDAVHTYINTFKDGVTTSLGYTDGFMGPEYGIAKELNSQYEGRKALIFKSAAGGVSLYKPLDNDCDKAYGTYCPPSLMKEGDPLNQGFQYRRFFENLATVIQKVKDMGYTPNVKGLCWAHGGANLGHQTEYKRVFKIFVEDFRKDLTETVGYDCSSVPIVISEQCRSFTVYNNPWVPGFVDMQRELANEISNCSTINTDAYQIHDEHGNIIGSDDYHFSGPDMVEIGRLFAKEIVSAGENLENPNDFLKYKDVNSDLTIATREDLNYSFKEDFDDERMKPEFGHDFSSVQGQNNLYYIAGQVDKAYTKATYNSSKSLWEMGQYQEIHNDFMLSPGDCNGSGVGYIYKATTDGHLKVEMKEENGCYTDVALTDLVFDGVTFNVGIRQYNSQLKSYGKYQSLYKRNVRTYDYFSIVSTIELNVKAGDIVLFGISPKETPYCDIYYAVPKFTFTSNGGSPIESDDIGEQWSSIEQYGNHQGDFNWYYLSGTVDEYYLCNFNEATSTYEGYEPYATINGEYISPGDKMPSMKLFACTQDGTLKLESTVEKVTDNPDETGDGSNFKVLHVKKDGQIVVLYEKYNDGTDFNSYHLDFTLDVRAGDKIIYYVDSGNDYSNGYDTYKLSTIADYISTTSDPIEIDIGDHGFIDGAPLRAEFLDENQGYSYFSTKQGDNGYFFAYGKHDNYKYMQYDGYTNRFQNPSSDAFTVASKGMLHPGYNQEEAILIKRISETGEARIMSFFNLIDCVSNTDISAKGDGVVVKVYINGELQQTYELLNIVRRYFDRKMTVHAGDEIMVTVGNKSNDSYFDATMVGFDIFYYSKTGEKIDIDTNVAEDSTIAKPDDINTPVLIDGEVISSKDLIEGGQKTNKLLPLIIVISSSVAVCSAGAAVAITLVRKKNKNKEGQND